MDPSIGPHYGPQLTTFLLTCRETWPPPKVHLTFGPVIKTSFSQKDQALQSIIQIESSQRRLQLTIDYLKKDLTHYGPEHRSSLWTLA